MSENIDAAEIAAIAACLDSFPAQAAAPEGTRVPIAARIRERFAAELHAKGLRPHPDLAVLFPIPGGKPRVMGFLNPTEWVDRPRYEQYLAEHADAPTASMPGSHQDAVDKLTAMLAAIKPELAQRIPDMTDEERHAAARDGGNRASLAVQRLKKLTDKHPHNDGGTP